MSRGTPWSSLRRIAERVRRRCSLPRDLKIRCCECQGLSSNVLRLKLREVPGKGCSGPENI